MYTEIRGHNKGVSSYRELLDEIRFGLAKEYLAKTNLSMEEICGLLGYSESGNFSHAFRRWNGQSPRAWRKSVTAGDLLPEHGR